MKSHRRTEVKTTTGMSVHLTRQRPKKARCTECQKELHGIPREWTLSKTQRRPERPFGGVLCSGCTRKRIVNAIGAQ